MLIWKHFGFHGIFITTHELQERGFCLFLYWKPLVAVLLKTSNLGIALCLVFIDSRLVAFVYNIPSHVPSKKS